MFVSFYDIECTDIVAKTFSNGTFPSYNSGYHMLEVEWV